MRCVGTPDVRSTSSCVGRCLPDKALNAAIRSRISFESTRLPRLDAFVLIVPHFASTSSFALLRPNKPRQATPSIPQHVS